ncbi:hypothetical protein BC833DRAFT_598682, partial [Globomyces pollinis-pini]
MRFICILIVLFLLGILAILGFNRNQDILPFIPSFLQYDKSLHFTCFGVLTFFIYFIWERRMLYNLKWTCIIMFLFSIVSECVQAIMPFRNFDLYDILANLIGSTIGVLLAIIIDYVRIRWWKYQSVNNNQDTLLPLTRL